jgi:hypothetical protein
MLNYTYKTQELTRSGSLKPDNSYDRLERQRYLAVLEAAARWDYEIARIEPLQLITLEDYRQWLIFEIGSELTTCVAFKEEDGSQLTATTTRFWKVFPKAKLVPEPKVREYPIGGRLGSLAGYSCCLDRKWSREPLKLGVEICTNVWQELLIEFDLSPQAKLTKLFSVLDLNFNYLNACERALKLKASKGDYSLRRFALDESSFDRLGLRVLLGEISDVSLKYWANFHLEAAAQPELGSEYGLPFASYSRPYHHLQMCLAIGHSAGFAFLLQALVVELLIKAHASIQSFGNIDLAIYARDPNFAVSRRELGAALAQVGLAFDLQSTFGAISRAKLQSKIFSEEASKWGSFDLAELKFLNI